MKISQILFAPVLAVAAYATPSLACNAYSVNVAGHQLMGALQEFANSASRDYQFSMFSNQAYSLSQLAHHIGDAGEYNNCADAVRDFNTELAPQYGQLDGQIDPRLGYSSNYDLRNDWSAVENAYVALQSAVNYQ